MRTAREERSAWLADPHYRGDGECSLSTLSARVRAGKQRGIELLFLPPYSPHLNLIERLWRFVRQECLYSHYYEHFEPFKRAITQCLAETTGRHQAALNRLLTLEFQTFAAASGAR